jgi:uncharacterized protein
METSSPGSAVLTAVVTGGHPFDVPHFHRLFRAMPGVDAYPQDLENFLHDWGQVRWKYEAIVFYNMHMAPPEQPCIDALRDG